MQPPWNLELRRGDTSSISFVDGIDLPICRPALGRLGLFGLGFGIDAIRLSGGRSAVPGGRVRQGVTARLTRECGGLDLLFAGEGLAQAEDGAPKPSRIAQLARRHYRRMVRA